MEVGDASNHELPVDDSAAGRTNGLFKVVAYRLQFIVELATDDVVISMPPFLLFQSVRLCDRRLDFLAEAGLRCGFGLRRDAASTAKQGAAVTAPRKRDRLRRRRRSQWPIYLTLACLAASGLVNLTARSAV